MAKFYIEHVDVLTKKKQKIVLEGTAANVNLKREPEYEDVFSAYSLGTHSFLTRENVTITLEGVRLGEEEPVELPRFFIYWRNDAIDTEIEAEYYDFSEFNGDTIVEFYKDDQSVGVFFDRDIKGIVRVDGN